MAQEIDVEIGFIQMFKNKPGSLHDKPAVALGHCFACCRYVFVVDTFIVFIAFIVVTFAARLYLSDGLPHEKLPLPVSIVNQSLYFQFQYLCTEWFGDIIIRAFLQSFHYCFVVSLCRQQNDWNTRCVRIFLDHSAKLVTPYAGHHDVGEDDIRIFIGETGDSFVSVGNINHPIEVFKGLAEVVTESFVVFYNEQCIPVVRIFYFIRFVAVIIRCAGKVFEG